MLVNFKILLREEEKGKKKVPGGHRLVLDSARKPEPRSSKTTSFVPPPFFPSYLDQQTKMVRFSPHPTSLYPRLLPLSILAFEWKDGSLWIVRPNRPLTLLPLSSPSSLCPSVLPYI